jgi:hypothetical protein
MCCDYDVTARASLKKEERLSVSGGALGLIKVRGPGFSLSLNVPKPYLAVISNPCFLWQYLYRSQPVIWLFASVAIKETVRV